MAVKWEDIALSVARVVRPWRITAIDSTLGTGEVGVLEHVIHEISHLASIRIHPTKMCRVCEPMTDISFRRARFTSSTSSQVALLMRKMPDKGVQEETRAWGIEWHVWKRLGLTSQFKIDDALDEANFQGCDEVEVLKIIDDPHKYVMRQVDFVVKELHRLCTIDQKK